ncbi:18783_t:CDS:10 [Entrophospora sp. SA101]|nr:18783_t:CDS:10 [Entrophospora sp. SA101]
MDSAYLSSGVATKQLLSWLPIIYVVALFVRRKFQVQSYTEILEDVLAKGFWENVCLQNEQVKTHNDQLLLTEKKKQQFIQVESNIVDQHFIASDKLLSEYMEYISTAERSNQENVEKGGEVMEEMQNSDYEEFMERYKKMDNDREWKLMTGRIVEDKISDLPKSMHLGITYPTEPILINAATSILLGKNKDILLKTFSLLNDDMLRGIIDGGNRVKNLQESIDPNYPQTATNNLQDYLLFDDAKEQNTRTYMHPGDNPTKQQKNAAALGFSADIYPFFLALPENIINELLKSDMDHEQIIETMQDIKHKKMSSRRSTMSYRTSYSSISSEIISDNRSDNRNSINIEYTTSKRRKDFEHTLRDCDEILNFIVRGYVYATEGAVDLEGVGCEDETKLKIERESLEKIIVKCDAGQEIDFLDSHEEEVKRLNIIFDDRSEKEKYFQNEHYNEFKQKVWEVNHQDEPMPPLDADADDDVVVGRQKESLKCPITTLLYEEPVTRLDSSTSISFRDVDEVDDMKHFSSIYLLYCSKIGIQIYNPDATPTTAAIKIGECLPKKMLMIFDLRQKFFGDQHRANT